LELRSGRLSERALCTCSLSQGLAGKTMRQIAKLTASDGTYTAGLGGSVTIVGNTIVGGAPGATVGGNAPQGEAYVFVKPIGSWKDMTETAELRASDGQGQDLFGDSISISGNTVAIGAEQMARGSGKAYVFVMPASGWTDMTQTAELTPSKPIIDSTFGNAVAIDGDTVAVGQAYKNHVYVFVKASPAGQTKTRQRNCLQLTRSLLTSLVSESRSEARLWWQALAYQFRRRLRVCRTPWGMDEYNANRQAVCIGWDAQQLFWLVCVHERQSGAGPRDVRHRRSYVPERRRVCFRQTGERLEDHFEVQSKSNC
jgi:hypothetical protein